MGNRTQRATWDMVEQVLDSIDSKEADVLTMYFQWNMRVASIAHYWGVPLADIENLLERAVSTVNTRLGESHLHFIKPNLHIVN